MQDRSNILRRVIANYESVTREYKDYLIKQVEKEVNKINTRSLKDLHNLIKQINSDNTLEFTFKDGFLVEKERISLDVLKKIDPDYQPTELTEVELKRRVGSALLNQYNKSFKSGQQEIQEQLKHNPLLLMALEKYRVIGDALEILSCSSFRNIKEKITNNERINDFHNHLILNSDILTKSRDSGLMTFLKGIVSVILGVLIAAPLVYKHLKLTRGHQFIKKAYEQNANVFEPKITLQDEEIKRSLVLDAGFFKSIPGAGPILAEEDDANEIGIELKPLLKRN